MHGSDFLLFSPPFFRFCKSSESKPSQLQNAKIRIKDSSIGNVFDESDETFAIEPGLRLTAPDGGEEFYQSSSMQITWLSAADFENVKISLSTSSGTAYSIPVVESTPNDGVYIWNFIPTEAVSDDVRIKIEDAENPDTFDTSDDDLIILQPEITITSPNGGEELYAGGNYEISWTSQNLDGNLKIEYSKDNFITDINEITPDAPNIGSYNWIGLPDELTTTGKIRITSNSFPAIKDWSDGPFEIIIFSDPGWGIHWGTDDYNSGRCLAVDYLRNIYVGGQDNEIANQNMAISKINESGNEVWKIAFGSEDLCQIEDLAVDSQANLYVCGWFKGLADFDPTPAVESKDAGTSYDGFLCKFDTNGNFQWVITFGSIDSNVVFGSMVIDGNDFIYSGGHFLGTQDFDAGIAVDNHTSGNVNDCILVKYAPDQTYQWGASFGGDDYQSVSAFSVDPMGYLYVTGFFKGECDFDPSSGDYVLQSVNSYDGFLSKYTVQGEYQWTISIGGPENDYAGAVSVDMSGDILLGGCFEDSIDLNPGAGIDEHYSNGKFDIFLAKYNANGVWQWGASWGGIESEQIESDPLAILSNGNVVMAGYLQGNIDLDPGPDAYQVTTVGSDDCYLSTLSSDGIFQWARNFGTEQKDRINDLVVDDFDYIYCTGLFEVPLDLAPHESPCDGELDVHIPTDSFDAFLIKYRPDGCW